MAEAEVGDDWFGDDPTVNRLQERAAEVTGKEAGLFVPSGTMANQISIRAHTRPGDEMIAHRTAHPIHFEVGGIAAQAGVQVRPLEGDRGQYDAADAEAKQPGGPAQRCRLARVALRQRPRPVADQAGTDPHARDQHGEPDHGLQQPDIADPAWPNEQGGDLGRDQPAEDIDDGDAAEDGGRFQRGLHDGCAGAGGSSRARI